MPTPSPADAATAANAFDLTGLQSLLDLVTKFDADLAKLVGDYQNPPQYNWMTRRMINDMRGALQYKKDTELPGLIRDMTPIPPGGIDDNAVQPG
jgi:hypothetical protein